MNRVLHGVPWFLPHSIGGTEVYVASLIASLRGRGVDGAVAVFLEHGVEGTYRHDGIEVRHFPVAGPHSSGAVAAFASWAGNFDIYHQHAWTSACGDRPLRIARAAGCATVFTMHVPDAYCLSGTMIRDKAQACDGRIDDAACARCWAIHRGLPPLAAGALASTLAPPVGRLMGPVLPQRVATALSARSLVAGKRRQLMELASLTDQMVAVCEWLLAALVANGLPAARLSLVRQGLAASAPATIGQHVRRGDHVRLAYLGRCTEVKGIDVAIAALRALDNQPAVTLDLHFAEPPDGPDAAYASRLRRLAAGDSRIRFAGPLPPSEVTHALRAFDIVVVPSRWLETGPLIALEALSAGAVVVGSDRGGIAELARIYPGIRLAPADDIDAWARALRDAIDAVRRRETRPCMPVRTMDEVAADMLTIYEAAMAHARAAGRLVGAVS